MPIDLGQFKKKIVGIKNIPTEIKPKKSKKTELIPDLNKSIELNLIKSIYANRFGSTTNKLKKEMLKKIIDEWNKENI